MNLQINIPDRHWVVAYNELTDECRFMSLAEEWLPFKYEGCNDMQPHWTGIGFYETLYDAYEALISE
jgi:hypothetical protein